MQKEVCKYRAFDRVSACYGPLYQEMKASVQLSVDSFYKKVYKIPSGTTQHQLFTFGWIHA